MKKVILLLAFLPLLLSCEVGRVERVPATSDRFTVSLMQGAGNGYYVITDTKTGREYLAVHIGYGTAIIELQPANVSAQNEGNNLPF